MNGFVPVEAVLDDLDIVGQGIHVVLVAACGLQRIQVQYPRAMQEAHVLAGDFVEVLDLLTRVAFEIDVILQTQLPA